ncbi:ArsR family transcriptional regulator [Nocardia sp. NPDC049707]|uniref:ArsR family transcriptional regulator n=1 Tax=Nocardia sp. NPDC049707 TaxID=3154735 RepID=UPI00341C8A41
MPADTEAADTVGQIAAEFGVTRPTIYRHLNQTTPWPRCTESFVDFRRLLPEPR